MAAREEKYFGASLSLAEDGERLIGIVSEDEEAKPRLVVMNSEMDLLRIVKIDDMDNIFSQGFFNGCAVHQGVLFVDYDYGVGFITF